MRGRERRSLDLGWDMVNWFGSCIGYELKTEPPLGISVQES